MIHISLCMSNLDGREVLDMWAFISFDRAAKACSSLPYEEVRLNQFLFHGIVHDSEIYSLSTEFSDDNDFETFMMNKKEEPSIVKEKHPIYNVSSDEENSVVVSVCVCVCVCVCNESLHVLHAYIHPTVCMN